MRRVNARFKRGPVDSGEESIALTTLLGPLNSWRQMSYL